MKTLPEILYDLIMLNRVREASEVDSDEQFLKAQKAIAKELMGIIGEDEVNPAAHDGHWDWNEYDTRNQLRKELRARLTAFIGHKEK